ncbi:unnamed protein product [Arctogadus glacialis]
MLRLTSGKSYKWDVAESPTEATPEPLNPVQIKVLRAEERASTGMFDVHRAAGAKELTHTSSAGVNLTATLSLVLVKRCNTQPSISSLLRQYPTMETRL